MAKGLTKRQEAILQFVVDYVQNTGYPPSIREIGAEFGIGSLRGVTVHLDALERKGCIERANTPRSIRVIQPRPATSNDSFIMLPILGSIAAGVPIQAQEHIEDTIPIPSGMVRGADGAYLLRVRGDSMVGDGIMPRDLVVVKPQKTAVNDELVAVLIEDEATVKRIRFDKDGSVSLHSSNPNYDPIPIRTENSAVLGRIVGLIRDYDCRAF